MIELLVFFIAGWLAVLTVVVLAVVRQVSGVLLAIEQRPSGQFSIDEDGPVVGTDLPDDVRARIAEGRTKGGDATLLLIVSATCGSCREILADFDPRRVAADELATFLLVAGRGEPAAQIVALAGSKFDSIYHGPDAVTMSQNSLSVHSSPFLLVISRDRIVAKRYVRSVEDLYDVDIGLIDGFRDSQLSKQTEAT